VHGPAWAPTFAPTKHTVASAQKRNVTTVDLPF
jgi:hypothetical protein